jgi:hypothetical protein
MVEDLRQSLDQLSVKSVDIVGHDLGRIVATSTPPSMAIPPTFRRLSADFRSHPQ